jgi:serine/threonine protein kinase/Tol biopolymer transport system component
MELEPGTKVGRYEILSFIGAGGMGQVYRANDAQLGRDVAIKLLPSSFVEKPQVVARFQQEARALGLLNHPNLVSVYDFGMFEDSFYIVLELLEGLTLRARLRAEPIPAKRAVNYSLQIARGMSAAHERGIVHRDLKPENVFLCRDGRIKILDFGLARMTPQLDALGASDDSPTAVGMTIPGAVLGTVGYMAPEQLRAEVADERTDIFAFGVILFEMITGRLPFRGATPAETLSRILKDDPDDFGSAGAAAPRGVEVIVRRCLEKRKEDRFQTAHDLSLALEAVSGSTDTFSLPIDAWRVKARRARPFALGAAALIATAFLGAFVWQSVKPEEPPSFRQLTFRRGDVSGARFAPDGSIVYSASWEGRGYELYTARSDSVDSRPLDIKCRELLAVSRNAKLALLVNEHDQIGTLAVVPLAGSAPREIADNVQEADWSPDGSQLAITRRLGRTYQIEYPIGKVLYKSETRIWHLRMSPDGKNLAFDLRHARLGHDFALMVIESGAQPREIGKFRSARGLAWTPDGKRLVLASGDGSGQTNLYSVSLSGSTRLMARESGSVKLHDVSDRGDVLLTRDDYREGIMARGPATDREIDLSWFDGSGASDISPDGKLLLLSEFGEAGGAHYSVYVRPTNGDPAVRLGDGYGVSLSPDGKFALTIIPGTPSRLTIVPLGAGSPRTLPRGEVIDYEFASWLPDQHTVVFNGRTENGPIRLYQQDVDRETPPRPLGKETLRIALASRPASPDGKTLVVHCRNGNVCFVDLNGDVQPLPLDNGYRPIAWSADGKEIFVYEDQTVPAKMSRFNLETKQLKPERQLMPADPTGVYRILDVVTTPDGNAYAYGAMRNLSTLYMSQGMRF